MNARLRTLPVGKLPADLLAKLLRKFAATDPRVVVGPDVGQDCAVVRFSGGLLVFKSDPITFATEDVGYYLVQVNANDIATTGAQPRWLLLTMLLPEGRTSAKSVERIAQQVNIACREIGVTVIGGHTEITHGLQRPILVGTLIGEVAKRHLITPQGARPGDRLLLTKGVPIEATAILAREFPDKLAGVLRVAELRQARSFLRKPGISVVRDAQIALRAGKVTAMHDPTEGGLVTALWELAKASKRTLCFDPSAVPIPPIAARVCRVFGIDPLRAIASGALLLSVAKGTARRIRVALESEGIVCAEIGGVERGLAVVWRISRGQRVRVKLPARDELARLFESTRT
jgi:hydrogenase expression/formation protein HypE